MNDLEEIGAKAISYSIAYQCWLDSISLRYKAYNDGHEAEIAKRQRALTTLHEELLEKCNQHLEEKHAKAGNEEVDGGGDPPHVRP